MKFLALVVQKLSPEQTDRSEVITYLYTQMVIIVTARIRSMGKVLVSLCLSVHTGGGG